MEGFDWQLWKIYVVSFQKANANGNYSLGGLRRESCPKPKPNFEPPVMAFPAEIPWTASSLFSAYASFAAFMMLLRSVANDLIPSFVLSFLQSTLQHLFTPSTTEMTIVIENQCGGLVRNEVHDAAETYLRTKIGPSTERFKVSKTPRQKILGIGIEKNQAITDAFRGSRFDWKLVSVEPQGGYGCGEKTYFELTFNKKLKEKVLSEYLPFVLDKAKEIKDNERIVKLHSMNCPYGKNEFDRGSVWGSVNLEHPVTFDKLAMDPDGKKALIDDLNRFVTRKEYYKKVGKAWKRGYLLYGPPGTGKSSLVAAMANYLKYDIYDLELTSVYSNLELKKKMMATTNRSIVVIEDIDCSAEIKDQDHGIGNSKLTLSGLLNFIDGLWSSCGDERIIVFTTNHKDRLDPALLRPGRMDMHIHMSFCKNKGFRILAKNYLGIEDHHWLFDEIEALLEVVEVTPAEMAEELMKNEDADVALNGVVNFLNRRKLEADDNKEKGKYGDNNEREGKITNNKKEEGKIADGKDEGKSVRLGADDIEEEKTESAQQCRDYSRL
ncbi:hypothetical protein RJ640_018564 [Escallonia rubra]|uniref:AAA+ ATPase domain-containing protein n=1 Tax=Escallonia rubra TaxID=112253 RepID=A0AA88REJ4_9ASTE|nr:hypothetical protein RJ640_018564 [Escallonia rubra]